METNTTDSLGEPEEGMHQAPLWYVYGCADGSYWWVEYAICIRTDSNYRACKWALGELRYYGYGAGAAVVLKDPMNVPLWATLGMLKEIAAQIKLIDDIPARDNSLVVGP